MSELRPAGFPLWWEGYAAPSPAAVPPAEALPSQADVVIVGGGFTGLWTAYYLLRDAAHLSVLVLEAEHVGFGASGRNGGWVSALFPVDATTLAALVGVATCKGATLFEPTLGRALLAIGMRADAADDFSRHAAALGFIVEAADPRRAIAACAGAPACRSGCMPARDVADAVTGAAAAILDGTVTLHISGCPKGCANPRAATLALVGSDAGLALSVNGRAAEAVPTGCATTDLVAATARLAATIDRERRPGETAAASIARLGASGLASALCPEPAHA
ncbi:MAG: FAD-dependent oxidoreductase [Tetrasphaera sp.]|nr:FAD-dependent oxidoreductase [Tetrasphaera sp.]